MAPTRKAILLLVIASILLKCLVAPFFMHMDLLSEYRRVHWSVENGAFFAGFNRLVTFWIECAFYAVTHFLVTEPSNLLNLAETRSSTASIPQHFLFVSGEQVFRQIFIFKLPYLVFDYLGAYVLWRVLASHKSKIAILAFWMFNPVIFYNAYLFGRFDTIALFFVLATFWGVQRQRWLIASLFFGLALNSREVVLILLPAFMLTLFFCTVRPAKSTTLLSIAIIAFSLAFPYSQR